MQNRILFIDILKGFTILCVIFGHLWIWHVSWFVYSFHMPLFFILSGFFFNPQKPILKRLKYLITPYLLTALALTIMSSFHSVSLWLSDSPDSFNGIYELIKSIVFGCAGTHYFFGICFTSIGAIWFLLGLGWATLILWLMAKAKLKTWQSIMVSIALLCLGYYSSKSIFLPLSLQPGLIAVFFVYIGGLIYRYRIWENHITVGLCCGVWFLLLYKSYRNNLIWMDMAGSRLPYFPMDVIGGVAASIVLLSLTQYLEKKKFFPSKVFLFFGQASLLILCFHNFEWLKFDWRIRELCDHYELGRITTLSILIAFKLIWATLAIYLCRYISAYRKSHIHQAIPQSTD